jgi:hypothetical protein
MTTDDSYRYLAFYHVCFALATSVGHSEFRYSDQHAGEAYFKRARSLIGNPLDTVRFTLSDVPVLALMGFYLMYESSMHKLRMRYTLTSYTII